MSVGQGERGGANKINPLTRGNKKKQGPLSDTHPSNTRPSLMHTIEWALIMQPRKTLKVKLPKGRHAKMPSLVILRTTNMQ